MMDYDSFTNEERVFINIAKGQTLHAARCDCYNCEIRENRACAVSKTFENHRIVVGSNALGHRVVKVFPNEQNLGVEDNVLINIVEGMLEIK